MNFIAPDVGKITALELLNAALNGEGTVHLASNDVSISSSTVIGDFTECSGSGYSAQTLESPATPTIDGSDRASSEYSPATFSGPDDGSNIYMVYILDSGGNLLLAGRIDSAPVSIPPSGTLVVTFTALLQTLFT